MLQAHNSQSDWNKRLWVSIAMSVDACLKSVSNSESILIMNPSVSHFIE